MTIFRWFLSKTVRKTLTVYKLYRRLLTAQPFGQTAAALPFARFLSERENEVLQWMAEGKRNSEITPILGITASVAARF